MNIETVKASLAPNGFFSFFMPEAQRSVLLSTLEGEEGGHFVQLLTDLRARIETMPKTYETDGQGNDAVVHLHYFMGSIDAWITEKDAGVEGDPDLTQSQAFGKIRLSRDPQGAELGYISIQELIDNRVELDLYWTPKKLSEVNCE